MSFAIEHACASPAPSMHSEEKKQLETNTYKEVTVMKKLSAVGNLNVIHLVGCIRYPAAIVMEYAPLGNLYDYLNKYKNAVSVCVYCMGQGIRMHAVYRIALRFIIGPSSHTCCVYAYVYVRIIHMQRLPGAAIQPPPSHVVEKFQSYYNTITLTSLDMLTFANQIASGMVSEAKVTLAHCVPCMLMNSSIWHLFSLYASEFVASMHCTLRHLTHDPLPMLMNNTSIRTSVFNLSILSS